MEMASNERAYTIQEKSLRRRGKETVMATRKAVTPQSSPACSRKRPRLGCLAAMYLATRREANANTIKRHSNWKAGYQEEEEEEEEEEELGLAIQKARWRHQEDGELAEQIKAVAPPQPEGVDQLFQTVSFPTISQMHTK
ncbi:hypothetical protein LOK49_LG14G00358 [Camellia lanceoleosa]|uniref:Uncharacterized protein n=1 Tax=Camellia lanceoleosa TaxID=1840588 RepID=A0ACC0F9N6_9ERIC|nr:hypothetical protein LOK49_LG14G00358 [Camellia lanceoleosa]